MASATIQTGDKFPDGTLLSAYLRSTQGETQDGPSGTAVSSATTSNGTATFSGLTEDERYVAWGQVAGAWKRQGFILNDEPDPVFVKGVEVATKAQLDSLQTALDNLDLSELNLSGYATTTALANHEADTTSIHGITNTASLATTSNITTHEADTTNVHGITNTASLATQSYVTSAISAIDLSGYSTPSSVATAIAAATPKTGTMGFVAHGATAGTARVTGFSCVVWVGSVEPTQATNGDIWIDTSA